MKGAAVAAVGASRDRSDYISLAKASAPPKPRPPLVFDDSSQGSDVFPASGDRDVTSRSSSRSMAQGARPACAGSPFSATTRPRGMVS
jgi:hypothetical protein